MIMQGVDSIFETDLLKPLVEKIQSSAQEQNTKAERIIADHVRTSVF